MPWSTFGFLRAFCGRASLLLAVGVLHDAAPLRADTSNPNITAAPTLPGKTIVMHRTMLHDPYVDKDFLAVLVPDGWKMVPQFAYNVQVPIPSLGYTVFDPANDVGCGVVPATWYVDGRRETQLRGVRDPAMREKIEKLFADGTQVPFAEVRGVPRSARDFVERILLPRYFPEVSKAADLKFVSETDLPDYAKVLSETDRPHRKFIAGRIRVMCTLPQGPRELEFFTAVAVSKTANGETDFTHETTVTTASAGKLDEWLPTLHAILFSGKVQLEGYATRLQAQGEFVKRYMNKTAQEISDALRDDAARMKLDHELAMKGSDERREKFRENFANQQQAKDQAHQQMMHYINNTSSYTVPGSNTTYTLPANYSFQYVNNRGDVIQSNDATYHPPVDPQTSWQQLQKAN